ncbi:MAG: membrane protein insertase YidC [Deltaproteobacteria bacterium]
MEKRMILAIVLSIVVMFGYQMLFMPPKDREAQAPAVAERPKAGLQDNLQAGVPGRRDTKSPGMAPVAPGSGALVPRKENPLRWITVHTPLYSATIATGGGGVQSFHLNRYMDRPGPDGKPLDIIGSGEIRPLPLGLYLEGSQPAFPPQPVFASDAPDSLTVGEGEEAAVRLSWESSRGVRIVREYRFAGGKYEFHLEQKIANGPSGSLRLRPGVDLSQTFTGELKGDSYSFHGAVVDTKGKVDRYKPKDIDKGKIPDAPVRWAAADAKYFTLIVFPSKELSVAKASRVDEEGIRLSLADSPTVLGPNEVTALSMKVFMGPKEYSLLQSAGKDLELLVDYGWFSFLAKPLVWLLSASNRVTGNYGIDIIFLTILIKILFYPLTQKSMASMKKMQELAPVINKLKEKYKDDKMRQNQEMMNLYKTYNINPMSGCLPMILQIPVFIALYKGLLVAIELRHSPFFLWINDLSAPEHLWDIAVAGYTIPIRLLPLLMGISMFFQQKLSPSGGMDPTQQKMMMFLPLIFTFMFWGFPTGLTIYWLVNNLLSIGQQILQNRQSAAEKAATA